MPSARERGARILRSVQLRTWALYVPVCVVSSTLAVASWDARRGAATDGASIGIWLLGILAAAGLAYRRRFPVAVVLGTSAVAIAVPLDPMAALIAFGSLTVRRLDRVTAALGGLVLAATTLATWRDSRGTTSASSFWQMLRASPSVEGTSREFEPLTVTTVLIISGVLIALTFGGAMLLRDRSLSQARRDSEAAQQVVVDTLSTQLARQAERERIAREVHDALGHRLSLLSLHAGALELAAADNPRAAESAALVRANAQQSMADLRHLLATLQSPDAPDVAAAVPSLRDVTALVDESAATGVTLVSTIHLESVDRLDAQTSRSAYRLTQELLTNARKHAPGIGVRVIVRATPAEGVVVEVANHVPEHGSATIRPGRGLTGARTRVEQLGGDWGCWIDESRVFRAAAHLPWVWSADAAPTAPGLRGAATQRSTGEEVSAQ